MASSPTAVWDRARSCPGLQPVLGIGLLLLSLLALAAHASEDFEQYPPESPEVTEITEDEPSDAVLSLPWGSMLHSWPREPSIPI